MQSCRPELQTRCSRGSPSSLGTRALQGGRRGPAGAGTHNVGTYGDRLFQLQGKILMAVFPFDLGLVSDFLDFYQYCYCWLYQNEAKQAHGALFSESQRQARSSLTAQETGMTSLQGQRAGHLLIKMLRRSQPQAATTLLPQVLMGTLFETCFSCHLLIYEPVSSSACWSL